MKLWMFDYGVIFSASLLAGLKYGLVGGVIAAIIATFIVRTM